MGQKSHSESQINGAVDQFFSTFMFGSSNLLMMAVKLKCTTPHTGSFTPVKARRIELYTTNAACLLSYATIIIDSG